MTTRRTAAARPPEPDAGVLASTMPELTASRTAVGDGRFMSALPLASLFESPMNPRQRFDPGALDELTGSIRAKGVLTPLLARPVPGWSAMPDSAGRRYEIAAGHRRFRAARAAGLEAVPVLCREMTDVDLLEVLVIENDQRADVHPLEEADGYRRLLMPGTGYDVARVAARVGRSVKYVYDRLKLLELTKDAQRLFLDGRFTAGHAILLARLRPADQARAIVAGDGMGRHPALFEEERCLAFDDELQEAAQKDPYLMVKPVSVREFAGWIARQVKFDRDHVDPMLFPETAATLEKAAGEKLKVILITREYRASDDVRHAGKERIFGEQAWKRAGGEGSKTCERSRVGLVACGPGQGEAFMACIDKERCGVHWAAWQKQRTKRQAALASDAEENRKRQEQEKRREAEQARWKKALPAILGAVAAAVKKAPTKPTGLLAKLILDRCQQNYHGRNIQHADYVPLGSSAEDLVRHAAFVVLADEACEWPAFEEFPKRARAFGVDVKKIVDEAAPVVQTSAQGEAAPAKKAAKGRGRK